MREHNLCRVQRVLDCITGDQWRERWGLTDNVLDGLD